MSTQHTTLTPNSNMENEKQIVAESSVPSVQHYEEDDGLDGQKPTEEEKSTLRRIGEPVPKAAFLVAVVELCERFTYYGASGIFQNYISKPRDGSEGRGALGIGAQGATGLSTFFQFWCYCTFCSKWLNMTTLLILYQ